MTGLTTHVLDTALGKPAEGLRIDLYSVEGDIRKHLKTVETNSDGRVDGGPILIGDAFKVGTYELLFHAGITCAPQARRCSIRPFSISCRSASALPIRRRITTCRC